MEHFLGRCTFYLDRIEKCMEYTRASAQVLYVKQSYFTLFHGIPTSPFYAERKLTRSLSRFTCENSFSRGM